MWGGKPLAIFHSFCELRLPQSHQLLLFSGAPADKQLCGKNNGWLVAIRINQANVKCIALFSSGMKKVLWQGLLKSIVVPKTSSTEHLQD